MDNESIKEFLGKNVIVELENRSVSGNLIHFDNDCIKLETDYGIIEILNKNIKDINRLFKMLNLNVFVCKNEVIGCKGMRMLSTKDSFVWKCKYFEKYKCPIKRICNFNELPLNIKVSFLDGLHNDPPVIEEEK